MNNLICWWIWLYWYSQGRPPAPLTGHLTLFGGLQPRPQPPQSHQKWQWKLQCWVLFWEVQQTYLLLFILKTYRRKIRSKYYFFYYWIGVTGILVMGFAIVCLCYNRHKRTPSSSAADIDVISLNSLESTVIFDRHDKLA